MIATDHVELRRWMVDMGFLRRSDYGTDYRRGAFPDWLSEAAQQLDFERVAEGVAEARSAHDTQREARRQAWLASQIEVTEEAEGGQATSEANPDQTYMRLALDQAHNAMERKLFMMKGFHHPHGSQQAFLQGLAHLYNFVPDQRRAQHAGQCAVEVAGGKVPTRDWLLNLQILTSGGFR